MVLRKLCIDSAISRLLLAVAVVVRTITGNANPGSSDAAVCFSGHARSLVQPRVYESLKHNMVDALGGGPMTPADLFFYLDLDESDPYSNSGAESTVGSSRSIPAQRLNDGWDTGPGAFNVTRAALAPALAVLQPVAVAIHAEAEATGRFASISSSGDCACPSARARPQLLKLQRCYALVTEHEKQRGWRYAWIARARPDLGWLWPLPAAALFDHRFVYVPANYWPMGDQFALLPRPLAGAYFQAILSLNACVAPGSPTQTRWLRDGAGLPEQVLWKHLHDLGVPVRHYPFPFVIVRPGGTSSSSSSSSSSSGDSSSSSGGVCASLWNIFSELCVVQHDLGRSPWQAPLSSSSSSINSSSSSSSSSTGGGTANHCSYGVFQAASAICNAKFPEVAPSSVTGAATGVDGAAASVGASVGVNPSNDQPLPGVASSASFPESELESVHAILESLGARIDAAVDAVFGGTESDGLEGGINGESSERDAAAAPEWAQPPLFEGASHPVIVTSTGGIAQAGQVATALVLRAASASTVERGLKCVLAELYRHLRDLYEASYTRALAATAASGGSGAASTSAGSLPKPVPRWRPVCSNPSSLLIKRDGGDNGGGFAGGALHEAYQALAAATATMVTCQGPACQSDGEDYAELIAALQHAL